MSAKIRRLIDEWRTKAVTQDGRTTCVNHAFYHCADELEALLPALPPDDPPALRPFVEKLAGYKTCDDPGEQRHCTLESGPYCGKHDMFMEDTIQEARSLLGVEEKG